MFTATLGILAFSALPAACGSDSGGGSAGSGTGAVSGGGAGGGAADSGVGGGSGGISFGGGGSGGGLNLDSGSGGFSGDSGSCAAESQTADLVPLDLYIMLDRSGSMLTNGGWGPVKTALDGFVADTASAGIGVGLAYFPGSPECMVGTYSNAAVPIAALPGNAQPISTSLAATAPGGQTPTLPAMKGAVDAMSAWLLLNPTHTGVIVLATDGIPNNCGSTVDNVAAVAQAALNDNPKILTFVIGVGTELTSLDKIAQSGGTNKAFLVDTTGNVTQQFIAALNAIRGGSIACEYLIPKPEGGTIDPGKVNVQYTPGNGGAPETFPKVDNEAACGSADGWYYDNPSSPTKVILCKAACDKAKQDSKATVSVAFGCKTVVK